MSTRYRARRFDEPSYPITSYEVIAAIARHAAGDANEEARLLDQMGQQGHIKLDALTIERYNHVPDHGECTIYSDFPVVCCPHCGGQFQLDDYYDIDRGDSFECARCEKEIHVISVDTSITAHLSTEPERAAT